MKERYWTNLVTSLRYVQCVLVLGPEVPAELVSAVEPSSVTQNLSYIEGLARRLAAELEDDNRRVTGSTLTAVAQQYEDTEGFGPNTMRARRHSSTCPRRTLLRTFTARSLLYPSA